MKIAVAMSGGVDSSAAAAILQEAGHELVGFTMQLWNQNRNINVDEHGDPLPSRCCSLDDVYDARRVAGELGFPFYVLNLEQDFERDVVQPFVTSYLEGETPIPCVACNSRLKFASLDRLAQSLGCEKVATGDYAGFIDRYLASEGETQRLPGAGEIVDTGGRVIGEHQGVHRYTVGQRRGLRLSRPLPLYVVKVDAERNRVVVGESDELLAREFEAAGVNWIAFDEPSAPVRAEVRVRYRHTPAHATIE